MSVKRERVVNAFTVDLEEWFHGLTRTNVRPESWSSLESRAEPALERLLGLLSELKVRATFFVLGDFAHNNPHLIKRINQAGHELGSHGYSHKPIHQLDPPTFRKELEETRQLIMEGCGEQIIGFRAPYFSIDQRCLWAFDVLEEAGYQYDSSVFPVRTILYGYPGATRYPYRPLKGSGIVEYPIATVRLAKITLPIAGGVYSRLLPYFIIRLGLHQLNSQGIPAIIYIHPWELDLNQPRIPVSARERVTHYGNRSMIAGKLRRLSNDFTFASLGEVHRDWLAAN